MLALSALFLSSMLSCAKQQFPPGGPEDKTPPEVLGTYPENGTARIERNPEVSISFSERMDKERTREAVFVSPPPDGEVDIDWKKNTLQIGFPDSLAADKTYLITVGSSAADQHNNRLVQSFSLAFSTGETLDSGTISGIVRANGLPVSGVTVSAYGLDAVDSSDFLFRPAQYITQTGSDGTYELGYISPGDYILFAYEDKNSDRKWNPPRERIGLPLAPALIGTRRSVASGIDFDVFERDTVALRVKEAAISQDRVLEVSLSRPARKQDLLQSRVMLVAIDGADTVRIARVFAWEDSVTSFAAIVPDLGDAEAVYLQIDSLADLWGNPINTIDDSIMLRPPIAADRRPPGIVDINPQSGSQNIAVTPVISIRFDEPVRQLDTVSGLILTDPDSVEVTCSREQTDEFRVAFMPNDTLKQGTTYGAALELGTISDLTGNRQSDSTVHFRFETINYDSVGSFSGNVLLEHMGSKQMPQIFFRALPLGEWSMLEYDPSGRFHHSVPPGKYCFTGFVDRNGDGFLSTGRFRPFEYSEPVLVFDDTITVRSRFETEDVELQIQ